MNSSGWSAGHFLIAEQLLTSEEGDCYMEVFSSTKGKNFGLSILSSLELTTKNRTLQIHINRIAPTMSFMPFWFNAILDHTKHFIAHLFWPTPQNSHASECSWTTVW